MNRRVRLPLAAALALSMSASAHAQIRTDASLGKPAQTLTGPAFAIPETMGLLAGKNLFHSFESFNVKSGESANFTTATSGIANVISRVTGGASTINGQIKLAPVDGTPAFFLVNPAGVTFGAGASIDVPGAFHVSTASSLKFPDGDFHADPAKASTFSSASPEAFGFLGAMPASLVVQGTTLATKPGQPISLVGGNVELKGATLETIGNGDIRIIAAGADVVHIPLSGTVPETHGKLVIIDGSSIGSFSDGEAATGSILLSGGELASGNTGSDWAWNSIYTTTWGAGNGGDIAVSTAGKVALENTSLSSWTADSGRGGDVAITAKGTIALKTVDIGTTTSGPANAGAIRISAAGLSTDSRDAVNSKTTGDGQAGKISITVPGAPPSIRTDGSIAAAQDLPGPAYSIPEALGVRSGDNLFFSFQTFGINPLGLNPWESATFVLTTPGIANIVGRVTGGTASALNGPLKIESAGSPALFLVNPAGVIFGDGVALDVPGAFHASTAAFLSFQDGRFHADLQHTGTLPAGAPTAYGFVAAPAASIVVKPGAALDMPGGRAIALVGGALAIDGAAVTTSGGGDIRLAAVGADSVELPLLGTMPALHGKLEVRNGGKIETLSGTADAGNIAVSAGDIEVDDARISSASAWNTTTHGGSIDVRAAGTLKLANDSRVESSSEGISAGALTVKARDIMVDGSLISSSGNCASALACSGHIVASGSLKMSNGGAMSLWTRSSGTQAVAQAIQADSIALANSNISGSMDMSVTAAGDISLKEGAKISAHRLDVVAGGDLLIAGSRITDDTEGGWLSYGSALAAGGHVRVKAAAIVIDGTGGISTKRTLNDSWLDWSTGKFVSGDAGNVEVMATKSLTLSNGGEISSSTQTNGNAGTVSVKAESAVIDGKGFFDYSGSNITGIGSTTGVGGGNAGSVNVIVDKSLSMVNGGMILSDTLSGNGGSVKVTAGSLVIDGKNASPTRISSSANDGVTGNAGTVEVKVKDDLTILNGGDISSNTFSTGGHAGAVSISAGRMKIDGGGSQWLTGVASASAYFSTGNAGSIELAVAEELAIVNGGRISSETFTGAKAGSVAVHAGAIVLDRAGSQLITGISSSAYKTASGIGGNAGSVAVAAGTIDIRNGAGIYSFTRASGAGGSVKVDAGSLSVDGAAGETPSSISASAEAGSSGQTGSLDVVASKRVSLSNGGTLSIQNKATVADPAALLPTSLTVAAPDIVLKDAAITAASTGNVAASNIDIRFTGLLALDPSSITTSSNLGNGGAIRIRGDGTLVLDRSQITTSVAGMAGNGGDIGIDVNALVMNTGFIQANTAAKNALGGNVDVGLKVLIPSGNSLFAGGLTPHDFQTGIFGFNVIQAAAPTGLSGTVSVTAPALDISGTLTGLSARMFDAGGLGRNPCRIGGGSSLAQVGRGGFAPSARGLLGVAPPAGDGPRSFSSIDSFPTQVPRTCANT